MRWLALLLVACGGSGSQPQTPAPLENKVSATTTEAPAECRGAGLVYDARINEPAIGATVVFSGSIEEQVAIADEHGKFSIAIDHGHSLITVYFDDRVFEHVFQPSYCRSRIRLTLDPPNAPKTPIVTF